VDEEQKLDDGAELLSASALLARDGSFGYIESRLGMKMSDKKPAFAWVGLKQNSRLAPLQAISNREERLLEPSLNYRKQTAASRSNRELSTNLCRSISSRPPLDTSHSSTFLTGSGLQTKIDVTCSKQTTEKFLSGARTHIKGTRIFAKMSEQMGRIR
jgi:hypothetical protein